MLLNAQKGNYAVGAFNVENMEMVMAVMEAAEELKSPVIMQTTPSTVKYAGLDFFLANVKAAAERASVPVAMHLDHGSSFELAMQAYRTGYTSIMIDGSHESFEGNIAVSKAVADACAPSGIPVEAELGKVGGKEDDLDGGDDNPYTDPNQAVEFVKRTGSIPWQWRLEPPMEFTKESRNWIWIAYLRYAKWWISRWCFMEPAAFRMKQ